MPTTKKQDCDVQLLDSEFSSISMIKEQVKLKEKGDTRHFVLIDLGDIIKKYQQWKKLMPRITPFYAVKCNEDLPILKVLKSCGASFDCASQNELETVLSLGVSPNRIVYANTCKETSMLAFAKNNNVKLMTFDNEFELRKIANIYPEAKLLLRIFIVTDYTGRIELGSKFGCHPSETTFLLQKARDLSLQVVGVSFHVGSDCHNYQAFAAAIQQARNVFDKATEIGFNMRILDIGGGFPGQRNTNETFKNICHVINTCLEKHFPPEEGVRIIAEPGRYFVASSGTVAVNVISKRVVFKRLSKNKDGKQIAEADGEDGIAKIMYYVNDGIFGSFLCKSIVSEKYEPKVLVSTDNVPVYDSVIWGPTCAACDVISESVQLPMLDVGDWIYFHNMGAYTSALSTSFNGMDKPSKRYFCSRYIWSGLYPEKRILRRSSYA